VSLLCPERSQSLAGAGPAPRRAPDLGAICWGERACQQSGKKYSDTSPDKVL